MHTESKSRMLVKGVQQYLDFIHKSIYHISDTDYIGRADLPVTERTFLSEADRYWMPIEDHRTITIQAHRK